MNQFSKHRSGLAVGSLMGLWHAGWAVLVAGGIAKPLMDWILSLHFISLTYTITDFNVFTAALLIAVTFVSGYGLGWIFAAVWNVLHK